MTDKVTAEKFLPTADTIRRMGGFDEVEYADWLKATCEAATKTLEHNAEKLVQGESVEFKVWDETRAHELWLRYYSKVKDALIRKGFFVDESITRHYGAPIGVVLTIRLED
jgi:hypothetical protein